MMEKILKTVDFSERIFNIKEDSKELSLPLVLRVQSQCLLSHKKTLVEGDVVTIHGRKSVGVLKGRDTKGRDVNLLTTCPHRVQLALPEDERKCFDSLKALCEEESRPKFVEIKLEKEVEPVQNGDRLKVLLVERGASGPLFMHFRNERGKHVRLPVDIEATFTACPPDGKEYFISEIANINKAPLALFIQFLPTSEHGNDIFHSLGIIEITEQTTLDMLFMTLKDGGNLHCCVCVTPDDLSGFVPKGYKEDDYNILRKSIKEVVVVEKIEELHGSLNPQESDFFFLIQFDKVFGKRKLKDKGKRVQSLAIEMDDDKEKKRSSFLAIFKDEKSKENGDIEKKEKKEKKKNKKEKSKEIDVDKKEENDNEVKGADTPESEEHSCKEEASAEIKRSTETNELKLKEDYTVCDSVVKEDVAPEPLPVEMSPKTKKKKSKEDKKKWKFDFKSKISGQEKKEKKKKKGNSLDRNSKQQTSSDQSEPCSPIGDVGEDDYELAAELHAIAAQNLPPEDLHKDKDKSKTIISRTWKKMKKRRRAYSASNVTNSGGKVVNKSGEEEDILPPLMAPDYPDDIYEQIPGEFMSHDIYEEAFRAYGGYEQPVAVPSTTDLVDSGFDELDQKALDGLRQASAPPPLPGNHPVMQSTSRPRRGSSVKSNKGTRISVDSEGFRRFYESMRASEAVIRGWGPEELEKALISLQLGQHFDKFNESQIDGSLLIDLDEAVLRDLGLNLFEARKLRKFVFGWRPDSMRESVYQQKYSKTSKNPSEWSTEMVADMIKTELGIAELAKFCLEHQVNGDLLKDIVVDEEVLNYLLTGKGMRLNAVKLKNYVLEGWRPPKKKETRTEDPGYEKPSIQSDLTYQPLIQSPNTIHESEAGGEYETPLSLSPRNDETTMKGTSRNEAVSPSRWKENEKTSRDQSKSQATTAPGINSLMQRYEKKSSNVDAPRPFKKVSSPYSPSYGAGQSSGSNSSFVTNMKMKFNDK